MEIDDNPIKEFVKKHDTNWRDDYMQAGVIVEEAKELRASLLRYGGHPTMVEAADVIITVMVLAELLGWLDELPRLVAEKMKINLEKPVGRKSGEKVSKE